MTDKNEEEDKVSIPHGEIKRSSLSTGGEGAGMSSTDTGGLDASGNELGADSPGDDHGRQEKQRLKEADAGALKP